MNFRPQTHPEPRLDAARRSRIPARRIRARAGFTLVELLIVVAVIAILASIAVPATSKVFDVMKSKDAQSTATGLVQAIDAFEQEWNILPSDWKNNESSMKPTDNDLLGPLMGSDTNINRTGERYFEDDTTDVAIDGLYVKGSGNNRSYELYDPWGEMYEFTADDGDGEIPRPSQYDNNTPVFKIAIVHSAGPDGDFGTDSDNTTSWGD